MTRRPPPSLLCGGLILLGFGIARFPAGGVQDWHYWFAATEITLGAVGITVYVHRAIAWLKDRT
jgi:hypothetical protein